MYVRPVKWTNEDDFLNYRTIDKHMILRVIRKISSNDENKIRIKNRWKLSILYN